MSLDENQFPSLIRELYALVEKLEKMFPGRPFTPDGHMVGSLAECFAAHYYDLELCPCSNEGYDAVRDGLQIEIKGTQGDHVGLRSGPQHLLAFRIFKNGTFEEVYNGPGAPVWALVANRPRPSNGSYLVSLKKLRALMQTVADEDRVPAVRPLPVTPTVAVKLAAALKGP